MTAFIIVLAYLSLLLFLGVFAGRLLQRTSGDYFLASRGIGPFMLLMSIFGTTMTAFALVGSTGKAFQSGIGVYGLMASWSGIVHAAVFFLVGAKVWSLGKRFGYVTQLSYFRDRYDSDALRITLFPVVVAFVMIYILMGVIGGGKFLANITHETFPESDSRVTVPIDLDGETLVVPKPIAERFSYDTAAKELAFAGSSHPKWKAVVLRANADLATARPEFRTAVTNLWERIPTGAVPYPAGMAIICLVVLFYVFFGGMRATAWANTFQTLVFMVMGVVAFYVITDALGGAEAASKSLLGSEHGAQRMARDGLIRPWQFLTYGFIPLSVGMFPHLFQHWLTARKASNFKLTVVAHPICIMITWLPCILLGMWASGILPAETAPNAVLAIMVDRHSGDVLTGLIGAGVLAAIMSSMDSQFLCLSSLFTNDIVDPYFSRGRLTDRQKILLGRVFVIAVVAVSYVIGLYAPTPVFTLGVWCFTGFAGLFPVLAAAIYWKRSNKQGAIAAVVTVAAIWLAFLPRILGPATGEEEEFLLFDIGLMPVTLVVAASTVALIAVTLLTPRPPDAIVKKFFGDTGN